MTTTLWQIELFVPSIGDPGTWRPMQMGDLRALTIEPSRMMQINAIRAYSEREALGGSRGCLLKVHVMELLRLWREQHPGIPARPVEITVQRTVHVF